MLYRVFPLIPGAKSLDVGGALHVPRPRQGVGRHDHPDHYGALYVSRSAVSAVAERIQGFRGQTVTDVDLRLASGAQLALAAFADALGGNAFGDVVDLDDPAELVERALRPSGVATRDRATTQAIALAIFGEGRVGFSWWSTLESSWSNVTLFAERAVGALSLDLEPELFSVQHPVLRAAADAMGVGLAE